MPKRNLIWVAVTIAVALAATALTRSLAPPISLQDQSFPLLRRVERLARQHYPGQVPPEAMEEAANAYLRVLDPWSQYIPPGREAALQRLVEGRRVGLGVRYGIRDGQVHVLGALPGSPAHGVLEAGDVILAVNEKLLRNPTRQVVDQLLAGPEGSSIQLLVERRQEPSPPRPGPHRPRRLNVDMVRRSYAVETVTGLVRGPDGQWQYMLDEACGIAYVRIREFARPTAGELEQVLRPTDGVPIRALVLDLRDNPGGPLPVGVDVVDRFLDRGVILVTRGKDRTELFEAHRDRTHAELRLAVLIDAATASAAEVVAGALQHHRRALLFGQPTVGKNCIQTAFALEDGLGVVMLTTGRYYFAPPAEASTQPADEPDSAALQPDVPVELDEPALAELRELRYRMEVMPARSGPTQPAAAGTSERDLARWMEIDRPLQAALEHLRRPRAQTGLSPER